MELVTLVCLAQSLVLIVVGSVVMLGVTTAMVKLLARDATQLAAELRAWQFGERGHGASPGAARRPKGVGQEHGLMGTIRALLSDLLAAASLVSLSGYVAWSVAF
ncbi:MAG TPA: hypothetical protein VND64_29930 [Pirellulales bacterium]|nr:hypothetical protein [Pirellulales bacterium]